MGEDVNSVLMGGGVKSASFENFGDFVQGEIIRTEMRQQTKFGSGEPLTWEDGKPRMQIVVVLQTPDQDDEQDEGVRGVYIKVPSQMLRAVREAVRGARSEGLEEGGILSIKYVSEEKAAKKGFHPQKIYEATYRAPKRVQRLPDDDGDPGPEPPF